MNIKLRKIKESDLELFRVWWRDQELIALTSGAKDVLSDQQVQDYFNEMTSDKRSEHFMIDLGQKTIGHISLVSRGANWHEINIVIGFRDFWGKGYGTKAIGLLVKKAQKKGIKNIYLEVRPNNSRAILAYEKCGFQKAGLERTDNPNLPIVLRMENKT